MDMLDFFRDNLSAQEILDYLEHLPRTSAYHSAIAEDEDLAEQMAGIPDQKPGPPRLAEFSPEVQVLAEVRDLVATLINVQIARAGKKPSKMKPYPRPVSAVERIRQQQRYQQHTSLVAQLLPKSAPRPGSGRRYVVRDNGGLAEVLDVTTNTVEWQGLDKAQADEVAAGLNHTR